MAHDLPYTRRQVLQATAGGAASAAALVAAQTSSAQEPSAAPGVRRGRIKQSVCKWCYGSLSLEQLAEASARLGLVGIDLMTPADFPTLKRHGLVSTMTASHKLTDGLCDPKYHRQCIAELHAAIEATAAEGWRNVICFSGNRRGIDDQQGIENCVAALKEIIPFAQEKQVTVQMELLNSRVNHADYMCDRSAWGIRLVDRVASDRFKLLYDIYHMQIMEGDVIRTIRKYPEYFGHYHTAGNPGRNEMDDTQELNYRGIVSAIVETGYDGYLGQEFIPLRDPLTSLAEAVTLCDV
jgi:hydroxypyruvate isomerase